MCFLRWEPTDSIVLHMQILSIIHIKIHNTHKLIIGGYFFAYALVYEMS